ncbi:MAG TPA: hypothetical protein VEH76_09880 [Methylocystis sp.]|nr:hypothetical protein [Methylocystis sp.]
MNDASETSAVRRQRLLQDELTVVQAAIERTASVQGGSNASKAWSAKLKQWRDDIESSLRRLPRRVA